MPEFRRVGQSPVPGMEGRTYSPAGVWVSVWAVALGFLIGALAVVFAIVWLFFVGVAVAVVGGLIGLAAGIFNALHGSGPHVAPGDHPATGAQRASS